VCLSNLWGGRGDDLSPQSASRHPLKDPEKGINLYNRRVWNKMRQRHDREGLRNLRHARCDKGSEEFVWMAIQGKAIHELHLPADCVFAAAIRYGELPIPREEEKRGPLTPHRAGSLYPGFSCFCALSISALQ